APAIAAGRATPAVPRMPVTGEPTRITNPQSRRQPDPDPDPAPDPDVEQPESGRRPESGSPFCPRGQDGSMFGSMLNWLRRKSLSPAGERRLLIALARAEEEVVRTHVQNVIDIIGDMDGEVTIGRALELYLDELDGDEPHATIGAQRV